jgi:hypothetical protein
VRETLFACRFYNTSDKTNARRFSREIATVEADELLIWTGLGKSGGKLHRHAFLFNLSKEKHQIYIAHNNNDNVITVLCSSVVSIATPISAHVDTVKTA